MSNAPTLRVTGFLIADAELRFSSGSESHALMFLRIAQPSGLPYEARQDCGHEPAQVLAAEAKRHVLRKGTLVTVHANGIAPRTDHGHAVLQLRGVTDVIPALLRPVWASAESNARHIEVTQ